MDQPVGRRFAALYWRHLAESPGACSIGVYDGAGTLAGEPFPSRTLSDFTPYPDGVNPTRAKAGDVKRAGEAPSRPAGPR